MAPIEERFSDSSGMPPAPRHDALRRDGAGPVRSHAEHGNEEARKPMPRILPGLPNVYLVRRFVHRWNYCRRNSKMYQDEIISEVWRNRDAYVAKHHHNLDEILADLNKRQKFPLSVIVDQRFRQINRASRKR